VIFSVGQRAGLAFIPEDANVGLTDRQTIAVNPNTFATSRAGVFAAGDCTSGTAFVIEAVARGHTAAQSILRYLRNEPMEPLPVPELPVVHLTTQEIEERLARGEIHRQSRIPMPGLAASERIHSFDEVAIGYDDQSAQAEAARCLACGVCSECMSCTFACGRQAILHDDVERISQIQVGAVILTPGYQVYQAHLSQEYGLGRYPNVVTALQYERMLSASGPTLGHVQRPSDQCSPQRIAFLQCVGSRDQTHDYCSSVCCMYAAKEAIMTIEHARAVARQHHELGDVTCQVFFMDTRAFSKGYEEYYRRAEHTYGVKYTRCRLSDVKENPITHNLIVRYAAAYENNLVDIEHLQVVEEEFDMVVLSVGMEISQQVRNLGRNLGVELDNHGFCRTSLNDPLQTSREGIFVAGPFREPKDIPETVIEASGAAACAAKLLSTSRFTLSREREYPPERSMDAEDVRLGVFVCHCGNNIGGYLDVPAVAQYAAGLPNVVYAEDNLYTCSQDTITHIISEVQNRNLNRVIVASCTPLTHEPLFQDAIRQAGLNPHLFEMANIRNQCSWVHSKDYQAATEKAKALVRMAIARSQQLEPLQVVKSSVNQAVLVVGGGAAGMVGSLMLADQGFPVILVERSDRLGGNLNHIRYFVPDDRDFLGNNGAERGAKGLKKPTPQEYLARLVDKVTNHPKIQVQLNTELKRTDGFKGNFTTTLVQKSREFQVQHGVILIATGGVEYRGDVYGYGQHPSILTQLEFEALLDEQPERVRNLRSVVMILCIGPAEKYCSRICCTTALKNALQLKTRRPDCEITILYRDIRTYGFKERVYQQARQAGVRFIHYEFDHKPEVYIDETIKEQKVETLAERKVDALRGRKDEQENIPDDSVRIKVSDPLLKRNFTLEPDLLVLSMPIVPHPESRHLAHQLKLSVDMDGFFQEAHIKLRPVDFNVDGIFMAGLAHYPKFLDETIAQAQAAAARAARLLVQETISSNAQVAQVDPAKCVGCLTCVRICPYEVPKISLSLEGVGKIVGAAFIEPAICHGCGTCAAECPAQAIQLKHHTDSQILSIVEALFQSQYNTA
jgi:heterodisulfide reductase subunit A-like polyferredoxin